jgi:hypothetical protein
MGWRGTVLRGHGHHPGDGLPAHLELGVVVLGIRRRLPVEQLAVEDLGARRVAGREFAPAERSLRRRAGMLVETRDRNGELL